MKKFSTLGAVSSLLALAACGPGGLGKKTEKEIAETAFPEKVLFGDTHLHTSNSSDAFAFGVLLGPEDALRFARGEEVTATSGIKAKLDRPLDFIVISDHSDGLATLKT
ncbi:MAG: hypothetical protein RLZZ366_1484, partial [Pseudomonadota bacterium]